MSCRSVSALLPLLVEGDLSGDEASVARDHLATCPACRARETALRESQAWLRDAAASAPPPPLDDRELAAIRAEVLRRIERPAPAWGPWWLPVATALGLLAALLPTQIAPTRPAGAPIARATLRAPAAPVHAATPAAPVLVAERVAPEASAPSRVRTVRTATAVGPDREPAVASGLPTAPDLRLELATPNPNVRIIWFVPGTPS